jgi:uncharacterized 2Fe-2S/4Fe-4S cluster protein (DUF4445 family)
LISELLRQAGWALNTRCGQRRLCDGCFVELRAGAVRHAETGEPLVATGAGQLVRGCEYRVAEGQDAELHIPARSLLAHEPQVVTSFRLNVSRAHDPLWQRVAGQELRLPDNLPFAEAVCQAVARQRDHDLPVRAVAALTAGESRDTKRPLAMEQRGDHWALFPLSGRSERPMYGAAIDIGTTTVVVLLVDLATGEVASTASALNAQIHLGDNVVTRINLCMTDPGMLAMLHEAVTQNTLVPLLDEALTEARISPSQLTCLVIAGNTTMLHLLTRTDPTPLGIAPFTPVFLAHRVYPASALALRFPAPAANGTEEPDAAVPPAEPTEIHALTHLLPGAAAYVGADITAGVLSSGMAYRSDTCLLVDAGTNGEIVLKHGDRMFGCATAAGPAFEGAGLNCGVRAGRGAISHVRLEGNVFAPELEIIGGGKPIGMCGTAYVDFVAQARLVDLITPTGRYTAEALGRGLVQQTEHARIFTVAHGRGKQPISVSESDIASLLQAKAAIAAGIICLLERVDLRSRDVDTLFLAGGFGFHMDLENVIRCGLLPGFRREQIRLAGNTALAGAYLALLDSGVLAEMKRVSARMEIVELNLDPNFESWYIDQLTLPEG